MNERVNVRRYARSTGWERPEEGPIRTLVYFRCLAGGKAGGVAMRIGRGRRGVRPEGGKNRIGGSLRPLPGQSRRGPD